MKIPGSVSKEAREKINAHLSEIVEAAKATEKLLDNKASKPVSRNLPVFSFAGQTSDKWPYSKYPALQTTSTFWLICFIIELYLTPPPK